MNSRLPYLGIPPPVPGNTSFYANFPPPVTFNPATPPPPISPIQGQGHQSRLLMNKKNRNWNGQYVPPRPYTIPMKSYHKRQNNYQRINPVHVYNQNEAPKLQSDEEIRDDMIPGTVVTKKKRKPMSKYHQTKRWNEADAEKALQAEKDSATLMTNQSLIIRFPDPPVNKDMVKEFHNDIENVHFPQAFTPRYCYIHLKENTNVEEVVKKIESTPFGSGFLKAELKQNREESKVVTIHDIDPYALYVGNLPMNVTKAKVIQHFTTCARIDIGYPKQMKNSRYAIVGFHNVDDAINAYKKTVNTLIDSRSMVVRFLRRNKSNGPSEEKSSTQSVDQSQESKVDEKVDMDLSCVKDEPKDQSYVDVDIDVDVKPNVDELNKRLSLNVDGSALIPFSEIKKENVVEHVNEDDVDDEEEQEEYDTKNDNFSLGNENYLEDDYDDYEDDDDYDVDDEDMSLNMNESNNYLPGDDEDDFCSDI